MPLTKQQKNFFIDNGYLIIDNFFTQNELDDFRESFRLIILSHLNKASQVEKLNLNDFIGKEFNQGILQLEKINHEHIAEIYDSVAQLPEFLQLISKKETSEYVNQLLNQQEKNPLYAYTCRCRIDPPSDNRRTYGWHQEVFYSVPKSNFLQTWAPMIQESTKEMGSISICVGSHKEGIAKQSWNEHENRVVQILVDDDIVQKYPEQPVVEMELGQLLIFNSKLFHKSNNNTTNKVRYSLIGMYHDLSNPDFRTPKLEFKYREMSPKDYYDKIIKNDKNKL